jgi:hypothetical protein
VPTIQSGNPAISETAEKAAQFAGLSHRGLEGCGLCGPTSGHFRLRSPVRKFPFLARSTEEAAN